ncbi:MAG: hypothetical protein A3J10_01025 [Candidatus Sungbacteria bacterium RIFCSPLOWO2_02_FULL_54_10]|uniref:tRNA-guanine(15) transglycosylase-like domain-containing protein n=2 Tax=Candidatus Sungiibacteriota TaxID=1817917 RepID=A0A1G2L9A2_9BACT|nr:MAG: hypothetical protein A3C92_04060 [Candidatus Sungbacteria bacterium RIFCSPHIGHO2_02_FULL_53_17]OHA07359.1 MAG: hypothetical protein A3B34_02800 [Candidatus Sungbacteria bacterium RIFCSPLOWO2_01_FULL_54_21]OHA12700.1 MAG: hypothetical protein A3J10_01025 [Candidatus Sungbacteria bacterium RIFCSPLOWO2_02_FULL_54_10]
MVRIVKKDEHTRARVGMLETPHGMVETPGYVVVGTHAKVRALDADDLKHTGTQLIIANTYHLWQTLGEEGLTRFPGLHAAMAWQGPLMTDSGGFQVFSMGAMREHGVGKVTRHVQHSVFNTIIVKHRVLNIGLSPASKVLRITKDGKKCIATTEPF